MSDPEIRENARWIQSVVEQYEGPLVRYAATLTGDLDRGRDVVQDTFLRLCREDAEQLDGHVAQWLFTVCRNRALDVLKKEQRMKTITTEQAAAQPSREAEQSRATETRDSADHVLELVAGLSANQQEVVRLKFQNGLSYREISAITELSVSNVGYLIHTAIKKLREQL